jgi:hypothetical protein
MAKYSAQSNTNPIEHEKHHSPPTFPDVSTEPRNPFCASKSTTSVTDSGTITARAK